MADRQMKSTLGLLKPSALTPKTDGETVTRHSRKVVHFLSTKNKRKLKPHRLISNSILSEVNLHFSKKGRKWNQHDRCYSQKTLLPKKILNGG